MNNFHLYSRSNGLGLAKFCRNLRGLIQSKSRIRIYVKNHFKVKKEHLKKYRIQFSSYQVFTNVHSVEKFLYKKSCSKERKEKKIVTNLLFTYDHHNQQYRARWAYGQHIHILEVYVKHFDLVLSRILNQYFFVQKLITNL